jgi:hypothetical protein
MSKYQKEIDILMELQEKVNPGMGISCVRSICMFLGKDDFNGARLIRQWDGDKTRSYPELEKQLTLIFGCRTHAVENCTDELCVALAGYLK